MSVEQVAIIGAGPAGLAAALQLERYGVHPLLLEAEKTGGLLHNANLVENYPGFPGGIPGPELVLLFADQARRLGVVVVSGEVVELRHDGQLFHARTHRQAYQARLAVVASGTRPVAFPAGFIPDEARRRVYYEVYSLLHLTGCRVAIVGAGDAAFDYALNLARRNDVLVLNRGLKTRCLPLLWQRAQDSPRISYRAQTRIVELSPAPDGGLRLECQGAAGRATIEVDYLVGALGRQPRLDFLPGAARQQAGELEARRLLYFAGDVRSGIFRQTAIAAGQGLMAAMQIYQRLKEAL